MCSSNVHSFVLDIIPTITVMIMAVQLVIMFLQRRECWYAKAQRERWEHFSPLCSLRVTELSFLSTTSLSGAFRRMVARVAFVASRCVSASIRATSFVRANIGRTRQRNDRSDPSFRLVRASIGHPVRETIWLTRLDRAGDCFPGQFAQTTTTGQTLAGKNGDQDDPDDPAEYILSHILLSVCIVRRIGCWEKNLGH